MKEYLVTVTWDCHAQVWCAVSDEIPVALESGSFDALLERVKVAARELSELNNVEPTCLLHIAAERRLEAIDKENCDNMDSKNATYEAITTETLRKNGCTFVSHGKSGYDIWHSPLTTKYAPVDTVIRSKRTANTTLQQSGIRQRDGSCVI